MLIRAFLQQNRELKPSAFVKGLVCARAWLTSRVWRSHHWRWPCRGKCPPRCPSSRARSAPTACSAAGGTCARGRAASASPCWCRRRCAWWGTASRAPGGRAGRSCPSSPGERNADQHNVSGPVSPHNAADYYLMWCAGVSIHLLLCEEQIVFNKPHLVAERNRRERGARCVFIQQLFSCKSSIIYQNYWCTYIIKTEYTHAADKHWCSTVKKPFYIHVIYVERSLKQNISTLCKQETPNFPFCIPSGQFLLLPECTLWGNL